MCPTATTSLHISCKICEYDDHSLVNELVVSQVTHTGESSGRRFYEYGFISTVLFIDV